MHSQLNSQTLQALRSEIEAVTTLQLALNRIALSVEADSLSVWDGPRPEDVDDVAADDGSFSREAVSELRTKAGTALAERYKEVERVVLAALRSSRWCARRCRWAPGASSLQKGRRRRMC